MSFNISKTENVSANKPSNFYKGNKTFLVTTRLGRRGEGEAILLELVLFLQDFTISERLNARKHKKKILENYAIITTLGAMADG